MRKINKLRMQNYAKPKKTISRDGAVGIMTGLRPGQSWVRNMAEDMDFSPKPPDRFRGLCQWVPMCFRGSKPAPAEVDHSLPYSAEVNNEWNYTYIPFIFLRDVDGGNFTT